MADHYKFWHWKLLVIEGKSLEELIEPDVTTFLPEVAFEQNKKEKTNYILVEWFPVSWFAEKENTCRHART